ncbi:sperm microtubule associated protein 1-like [Corticium candelabrum]|uniref:sperm microtubule associated protein 1-like n=1 Tax=Corticium candelabrum TaxID=121492 RepID=UPI002E254CB1|nr:sperm microtubule associated protein 1-like [Corticium candelabrum]
MSTQRGSHKLTPSRKWREAPPPEKLRALECSFILDGVAVSRQANEDVHRTNPTINIGIPQYYGAKDRHARTYVRSAPARTSRIRAQKAIDCSMMGSVYDKFTNRCSSARYLRDRLTLHSAGHSYNESIAGHSTVPDLPPIIGYNGPLGYRRNTFSLRYKPSDFGLL